jgi:hypothetical protein
MTMPGFISTLPPRRGHGSSTMGAVNTSPEFEPALNSQCLQSCQTSWSTCINSCQWWEWLVGSCVPKCRAQWIACVGRC